METIIPSVEKPLLVAELTSDKFLRKTNNGNNEIYIINHHNAPNVMEEIGRLREITFREAGGGTGKATDIDEFDTSEKPYQQLIVWDPKNLEIVGGYRYIHCKDIPFDENGQPWLATSELFHFTKNFIKNYLPYMIELGRSFVQPIYQPMNNLRKGMYSLDNIWDGLGALTVDNPDAKFFFGKITMYPKYNIVARDMILFFLDKYFYDTDQLVYPLEPITIKTDRKLLESTFSGSNYEENFKILLRTVRMYDETIPPLVNAYMNLSSSMKVFGTAINHGFGQVEETGIIINIADIYPSKKERHVNSYIKNKPIQ
ncbi:MAG TPA: GNAT family N-acetyltransferase [Bacteroidales bacterium]|nr:GNAT family N-acetyltransferase [Bacteroidales bacterium]